MDYNVIASVYNGFTLSEIKAMSVRQRDYWERMSRWKRSNGGV